MHRLNWKNVMFGNRIFRNRAARSRPVIRIRTSSNISVRTMINSSVLFIGRIVLQDQEVKNEAEKTNAFYFSHV